MAWDKLKFKKFNKSNVFVVKTTQLAFESTKTKHEFLPIGTASWMIA
jgi:hypothetical protein